MSILALTSNTLIGTPASGNLEYNGQFFGTDSTGSRAQLQRLVLATAQASTSGTSIDFTGIPAWVKRITVMLQGVSTSGTSFPQIQIGSGSVSTSGYASAANYGIGAGQFTSATTGFVLEPSGGATAANLRSGSVIFTLINSNTWVSQGIIYSSSLTFNVMSSGASPALGGALDRIRLTTLGGTETFDAGTVNIIYEG
jgi:hypothetical protein